MLFILLVLALCGIVFVTDGPNSHYFSNGYRAVEIILIGLLGWQVFGSAVKA